MYTERISVIKGIFAFFDNLTVPNLLGSSLAFEIRKLCLLSMKYSQNDFFIFKSVSVTVAYSGIVDLNQWVIYIIHIFQTRFACCFYCLTKWQRLPNCKETSPSFYRQWKKAGIFQEKFHSPQRTNCVFLLTSALKIKWLLFSEEKPRVSSS